MSLALSRRRVDHLQALVAVTALKMAEAQERVADHLDERLRAEITAEEQAADQRIFLRTLMDEFDRRGDQVQAAEARRALGRDSQARIHVDELLLQAWADRNQHDVGDIRASRARRARSWIKRWEVIAQVLEWLPSEERARVQADLWDGGDRSKLTAQVEAAADRWAARALLLEEHQPEGDANA